MAARPAGHLLRRLCAGRRVLLAQRVRLVRLGLSAPLALLGLREMTVLLAQQAQQAQPARQELMVRQAPLARRVMSALRVLREMMARLGPLAQQAQALHSPQPH